MYQFVLSKGVAPPFTLALSHPHTVLSLSVMSDQPITTYENTLILIILNNHEEIDMPFSELDVSMLDCFEVRNYIDSYIYPVIVWLLDANIT